MSYPVNGLGTANPTDSGYTAANRFLAGQANPPADTAQLNSDLGQLLELLGKLTGGGGVLLTETRVRELVAEYYTVTAGDRDAEIGDYLRSEAGRRLILAFLSQQPHVSLEDLDEHIRGLIAETRSREPLVHPHSHDVQSVTIPLPERVFNWFGAFIGAGIGTLAGLLLIMNYSLTTVTFGAHTTVSVNWVKAAIVIICAMVPAVIIGGIGRVKTRDVVVNMQLNFPITRTTPVLSAATKEK